MSARRTRPPKLAILLSSQPITDGGGGKRIALVTDANGNTIGLIQPLSGERS